MIERQLDIPTKDGAMSAFVCHPERGGPHPVILFFMDAPGIREELRDMARRLASVGYFVILPNLYYRSGVEELGDFIGEDAAPVRQTMFSLMATLTIPMVMADTDAMITYADGQTAASDGPIGCVGYCMSGQYAVGAAVHRRDRVLAAASIYGVSLVTDRPDSPHLAMTQSKARLYFGCAEIDSYAPLEMVERLKAEQRASGADCEVELYPAVHHGFAFPGRPAYDRDAAERHWERLFALFASRLSHGLGSPAKAAF